MTTPRRRSRETPLLKRSVLVLDLTENGMYEGGRERDSREVYFSLKQREAHFFPEGPFPVQTDDGDSFEASVTGNSGKGTPPKNLRSNPVTKFGEWLKDRRKAEVGDKVEVIRRPDGRYRFLCQPQPH